MSNNDNKTLVDKTLQALKNNVLVASAIIIALIVSGIVSFTETSRKLINILAPVTCESRYNKIAGLMKLDDPAKRIEGIGLLQEAATICPSRRQDLADLLQQLLMNNFPQGREVEIKSLPVLKRAIRAITSIPRIDENGFPLNIDIHQIRIQNLDLTHTNFKDISLWGNQFIDVILSRSNFQNADLGGTLFVRGSLEYSLFDGAKITGSFMDKRPTRFIETRLYGTNLERAMIDNCELVGIRDLPADLLERLAGKCRIMPVDRIESSSPQNQTSR